MLLINKLTNNSIGTQLFATVTIGVFVLLISAIYASTWVSNQQVRQLLIKQAKHATLNLAKNSRLALIYDSPENAKRGISSTLDTPGIVSLFIYRPDLSVFYQSSTIRDIDTSGIKLSKKPIQKVRILYEDKSNWYFFSAVIINDNKDSIDNQLYSETLSKTQQLIGYVVVISSKETLETISNGILLSVSVIASIISLLLLLALQIIISRITRPLHDISEVMKKAQKGEYLPHTSKRGPLEVQYITSTYNRMISALEERDEVLRQQNSQLEKQAMHDHLTGLTNRIGFEKHLNAALQECKKTNAKHILFYMDLDKFKIVNDSCGHNAGDDLLKAVCKIFEEHVRKDSDILARVGGDEFSIILKNCSLKKAEAIGNDICQSIEQYRFHWDDSTFSIGVSIGIVQIDGTACNLHEVISRADNACYIAKEHGRGQIHILKTNDRDLKILSGETQIASEIVDHLDNNKFTLYCQPIQNLENNSKKQLEILLRMTDKNGGNISPDKFISSAERYDLITRIDQWVIKNTFRELSNNTRFLNTIENCTININGNSLKDEAFFTYIEDQLIEFEIPGHKICFEITEATTLNNTIQANSFINHIHQLGCTISLDDFICNSSSFSHIKNIRIDYLKIHGDFFKDITNNPVNREMAKSINEISHILNIKTIAEHIEDNASLNEAIAIGIDYAQGIEIDKPEPLTDFIRCTNQSL